MKKKLVTLVVGLLISLATTGQSKVEVRAERLLSKDLEKVTSLIDLTKEEREKYSEIKKKQIINFCMIAEEFRKTNPTKFKEEVRKNQKNSEAELIEVFGKHRAMELVRASRKK